MAGIVGYYGKYMCFKISTILEKLKCTSSLFQTLFFSSTFKKFSTCIPPVKLIANSVNRLFCSKLQLLQTTPTFCLSLMFYAPFFFSCEHPFVLTRSDVRGKRGYFSISSYFLSARIGLGLFTDLERGRTNRIYHLKLCWLNVASCF